MKKINQQNCGELGRMRGKKETRDGAYEFDGIPTSIINMLPWSVISLQYYVHIPNKQ